MRRPIGFVGGSDCVFFFNYFFLEIVDTSNIDFRFVVHGCRSSEPQIEKFLLFLFRIQSEKRF